MITVIGRDSITRHIICVLAQKDSMTLNMLMAFEEGGYASRGQIIWGNS